MTRRARVPIHRRVGLAETGVLLIVGLTEILPVFCLELQPASKPEFHTVDIGIADFQSRFYLRAILFSHSGWVLALVRATQ